MLKLSGKLGYVALQALTRRFGPEKYDYTDNNPDTSSKLKQFFGPSIFTRFQGKHVVDFGCGRGSDAVAAALGGAKAVTGLDVSDEYLQTARALAEKHNVGHICTFLHPLSERLAYEKLLNTCDYVYSVDAFEHFADPQAMLTAMENLLQPGGSLLISFGPPWGHPYGAHQGYFSCVPWIQFLFSEAVILAVRKNYVQDDVSRLEDTGAGLNRMSVARFCEIIHASNLEIVSFKTIPVKGLKALADHPLTREYFTSLVQCEVRKLP